MYKNNLQLIMAIVLMLSPLLSFAGTKDRLNNLEAQYPLLEQRLVALEKQLGNQGLLDLLQTVQLLQSEMQQLQGDVEQLRYEMDGISKRQKDLYLDIDRRINDLSLGAVPGLSVETKTVEDTNSPEPTENKVDTPAPVATPVVKKDAKTQRQEYEAAFNLLRESRYPAAVTAFGTFLQQNPSSVYSPNAQYWLGKLHYVTKNFDQALVELNKVITQYAGSSKEPDARLNLGYTYYEMKDWPNARKMLESVVNKYPNSSAVALAEKRLQKLTAAGH